MLQTTAMASNESSGYHHARYHHGPYSHSREQHPPMVQEAGRAEDFMDTGHHYPGPGMAAECEQPLDLTVSSRPRAGSAGMLSSDGGPQCSGLDLPGRDGGGFSHSHSAVCMVKGCGCRSSLSVHHSPSHYGGHRHSPYPRYGSPSHHSPGVSDARPAPYPHPVSSPSQAVMTERNSSSPYYAPLLQNRRCHSPYGSSYGVSSSSLSPYSSDLMCRGASPALYPPQGVSSSVSSQAGEHSPNPSSTTFSQPAGCAQDLSPRPFYRPFEAPGCPPSEACPSAAPTSSSPLSAMEQYGEEERSASSSLLLLSSTARGHSSAPARNLCQDMPAASKMSADDLPDARPSQSDAPAPLSFMDTCPPKKRERGRHQYHDKELRQDRSSPAQDHTVASSSLPACELHLSPPQISLKDCDSKPTSVHISTPAIKPMQGPALKVVGTTPLTIAQAKREQQLKVSKENLKALVESRDDNHLPIKDSDNNSYNQASPSSSDSWERSDIGRDFPIPPDPNLKISALDYLISEALVTNRDTPFKPCNMEIRKIYSSKRKGFHQGRLTLVDLIELQVEASLKAC